MLTKTLKTALAALVIASGAAITSAPANAGSVQLDLASGPQHHGQFRHGPRRQHHGQRFGHGPRHRGICTPREAVHKAWRIGMNRPGIRRIGHDRIVVTGFHRGHHARLVFARYTPRCRVIASRGI